MLTKIYAISILTLLVCYAGCIYSQEHCPRPQPEPLPVKPDTQPVKPVKPDASTEKEAGVHFAWGVAFGATAALVVFNAVVTVMFLTGVLQVQAGEKAKTATPTPQVQVSK